MGTGDVRRFIPALCCVISLLAGCWRESQTSSGTPSAALSIQGAPQTTVTVGSAYAVRAQVRAPMNVTVGYSIANKPHWAAFNTTEGTLQGIPRASDVGTYPNVVISASDGSGS